MSDNFHKFLFLGVMLALTVFANQNSLSGGVVNRAADLLPAAGNNGAVPITVGLPPAPTASDSYTAPGAALPAAKPSSTAEIIKGILGDKAGNYLSGGSPAPVKQNDNYESDRTPSAVSPESGAGAARSVFYRVNNEPPPGIGARIVLVADLKSGEIFYEMNPAMRWPLASVTKLMTAEIIAKNNLLNQSATISGAEFTVDGSTGDLKVGETYVLSDLRNAMLIGSNNEAAMALADFYPHTITASEGSGARSAGSPFGVGVYGYDSFIAAMNTEARNLGLNDTYFSDPVGLSAANQSTADDLLAFARYIYEQYPEIFAITKKTSATLKELNSGSRITVKNINNFAGQADFLGGKTGYTDDASGNLLSIFSYEKQPVLIIVMGTEDRFGDTQKLLEWFEGNYK